MELSIATANAIVLQYDASSAQWQEMGSESGLCTLNILKSPTNEYRYVGQKISNGELVLNAYIFPEMNYDETTATFHQWFDKSRNAFGLNFPDPNMAKKYAAAIACALEQLNVPQPPPKLPGSGNERSVTPNKKISDSSSRNNSKVSPYATSTVGNNAAQNISTAAPTIPTATPAKSTPVSKSSSAKPSAGAPPPPGPPPSAPAPPGPPPPGPPPPGPGAAKAPNAAGNDFASQLQRAAAQHKPVDVDQQLNKNPPSVSEQKPSNQPPASGGGMDFLSEMKLKMSKKAANETGGPARPSIVKPTPVQFSNTNNAPSVSAKASIVDSEPSMGTYVTASDLEKFRIDLMKDILMNMEKMKNEIISSISARLN